MPLKILHTLTHDTPIIEHGTPAKAAPEHTGKLPSLHEKPSYHIEIGSSSVYHSSAASGARHLLARNEGTRRHLPDSTGIAYIPAGSDEKKVPLFDKNGKKYLGTITTPRQPVLCYYDKSSKRLTSLEGAINFSLTKFPLPTLKLPSSIELNDNEAYQVIDILFDALNEIALSDCTSLQSIFIAADELYGLYKNDEIEGKLDTDGKIIKNSLRILLENKNDRQLGRLLGTILMNYDPMIEEQTPSILHKQLAEKQQTGNQDISR